LPLSPDRHGEGDDNCFVNLSNAQAGTLGNAQGKGVIIDDEPGGVMQFSQPSYTVNEDTDNSVTITVNRTLDLMGTVTVNFQTGNSTAKEGVDYGHTAGTLFFGPGETTKTFQVPILHGGNSASNR